jgi:dephospho-CoA kinase
MIVGLTGGIGTGKSTVCAIFKRLGVPVISADEISHKIVDTDKAVFQAIVKKFGKECLTAGNKIDRKKIRQRIFSVPEERVWLEKLLHPLIGQEILRQAKIMTYPYCVAEIPLLIEAGLQNIVDRIVTVDCSEDLQLKRAMQRDHHSEEEVRAIIKTQLTRKKRLNVSDDVIENHGDMAALVDRVEQLHHLYLSLAV